MRKGDVGFPIGMMIKIFAALLLAVGIFMFLGSTKEKALEGSDMVSDAMDKLSFGCKNIDKNGPDAGATDSDTESVTLEEFRESMVRVYGKCKNDNKCERDDNACEKMTLDFGPGGAAVNGPDGRYMIINGDVLKNWGLDMFNNYAWVVPLGPNVYCEQDDADRGDDEIDPYYSADDLTRIGSGPDAIINQDDKDICMRYGISRDGEGSRFAVADGSLVTIKAKKHENDIWSVYTGESIDLNVKIVGGKYTTPVAAPVKPCTAPSECQPPAWGQCIGGTCEYSWCKTNPEKCKEISAICTLSDNPSDSTCTPQQETVCDGVNTFNPNPNGYKTKILGLKKTGDNRYEVGFKLYVQNTWLLNFVVSSNREKWYGSKEWDERNENSKVSLVMNVVLPQPGGYSVKIKQGCY